MLFEQKLTLQTILKSFKLKIGIAWVFVALENVLLTLIPHTLQSLTRLHEITERINGDQDASKTASDASQ